MVLVRGGHCRLGSDVHYAEERPRREVEVQDFWIDATPVRHRDFAAFVQATGYVTVAERQPDPADFPGAAPHLLTPGSAVFRHPCGEVDPRTASWWTYVPGASWRTPQGPGSELDGLSDHPVTQVAREDALAFCDWAGCALPTEAEWEYAARGGLADTVYAWGDEFQPDGRTMANIWLGKFPHETQKSARPGTEPVGNYPANGYGLFDMIGNVWEWTASPWSSHANPACACSAAGDGGYILKGGSYLCAWNHCRRFRPAARIAQAADSPTGHIGFRCIRRTASN